jgi:hypothetical protein
VITAIRPTSTSRHSIRVEDFLLSLTLFTSNKEQSLMKEQPLLRNPGVWRNVLLTKIMLLSSSIISVLKSWALLSLNAISQETTAFVVSAVFLHSMFKQAEQRRIISTSRKYCADKSRKYCVVSIVCLGIRYNK